MTTKEKYFLTINQRKLNTIHNDLMITLAMIQGSVNQEKQEELQRLLAEQDVINKNAELHLSALTLLAFSVENELYEVCSTLEAAIFKLNPGAK